MSKWCDFYIPCGRGLCNVSGREQSIPNTKYCDGYYQYRKCPWFLYWKEGKGNGRFYITTLICELLDKPSDDPVLTGLTNFREEVLEKDGKYSNFLTIYDGIGPKVCTEMFGDEDAVSKAETLYTRLESINELVKAKEYDKATEEYIAFTLEKMESYKMEETEEVRNNIGKKITKTLE